MTEPIKNPVLSDSAALLLGYGFDLGVFEVDELVNYWLSHYPPHWLRAAILEALHQGRYKAISVGQILVIWRRRGQPLPHYSYEFERAVSSRFPVSRVSSSSLAIATTSPATTSPATAPDEAADSSLEAAIAIPDSTEHPPSPEGNEPQDLSQIAPADLEAIHASHRQAIAPPSDALDLLEPMDSDDPALAHLDFPKLPDFPEPIDPAVDTTPLAAHAEPILPQLELDTTALPDDSTAPAVEPPLADPSSQDAALELWGRASVMHLPIHQYVPIIPRFETSTFYAKLRAVASDEML